MSDLTVSELPEPAYIAGLAASLRIDQAAALRTAEDDLQRLRGLAALVAAFIHDPAYDDAARHALAERLGLPAPAAQKAVSHGQ